ncbi:phage protease [Aestuariivirga sp. YIM B02566]|uniref:Uncharacterized protein n=1 Tax=Taklimakanibacter albus TaxID=2800327 RepID=A0ACC5R6R1_9HYPH|nr:phage protease [Aestuariivirga sp. YIM B02566]MBK1868263.1 hypothetical protein [Aestuariivirga sp. YIM B02566]
MLLPAGRIEANDGRAWLNDRPDVVVANFNSGGLDLPFDFEHGSEKRAPLGEFVPAAGWIVDVANREGAIWARVQWTERGRSAIEAKEVRYVSPAFHHELETGRIVSLSSAALCLSPAISSLPAIASRQNPQEKENDEMDRKALCQKLGLAENATDADIAAAIGTLQQKATASASQVDLAQYVPRADYDAVLADRNNLQTSIASRQAADLTTEGTALVEQAIKDAKIAPASKGFYLSLCSSREGIDKLKAFIASAPTVVPTTIGEDTGDKGTAKALTSQQKKIAASLGISEEDFAKDLAADAKKEA